MKNVLMIAFHFPPILVSSGIQRTLKFSQYLLDHNWCAQVLTVHNRAYIKTDNGQVNEIPAEVEVIKGFALDTSRHLSFRGSYISWLALPDRWVTWCIGGLLSGLKSIYSKKPKIIWSTYPIATAHLIGLMLHRLTGVCWVADFRDSMTEDDYPTNERQRKIYQWIERKTVKYCTHAIFTTRSAVEMYAKRYPEVPSSRWVLIPNGYDESSFEQAENSVAYKNALATKNRDQIVLLHSGVLYPSERDPTQFFQAVAQLLESGHIKVGDFKIILRATGHDQLHSKLIKNNNLEQVVFLEPGVPYEEALAEMLVVDGLLVFQAANCNHQVPAKIYEYLRAKRPIFAFTDPEGDTAKVLIDSKVPYLARLDNKEEIVQNFANFIQLLKQGSAAVAEDKYIVSHSRKSRTDQLAQIFDNISS